MAEVNLTGRSVTMFGNIDYSQSFSRVTASTVCLTTGQAGTGKHQYEGGGLFDSPALTKVAQSGTAVGFNWLRSITGICNSLAIIFAFRLA